MWLGRFASWHCVSCLIRLAHGLFLHEYTAMDLPFIFFNYLCTRVWNSLFADTHASKMWLNECFWKTNTRRSSWWLRQILQAIYLNNLRNLLQAFSGFHFLKVSQIKTLHECLSGVQLLFYCSCSPGTLCSVFLHLYTLSELRSLQCNSSTAIIITSLYIWIPPFRGHFWNANLHTTVVWREKNVLIHLLWTVSLHVKDIVRKKTKTKHISQSQYVSSKLYNDHGKILCLKNYRTFLLHPYFPG